MHASFRVARLMSFGSWAQAAPPTGKTSPRSKHACESPRRHLPANFSARIITIADSAAVPPRSQAALLTFDADSQVGIGFGAYRDTLCPAGSPGQFCTQLPPVTASSEEFWSLKLARGGSTVTSKWGETGITMSKKPPKPQPDRSHLLELADQFQRKVMESKVAAVAVVDSEGRFLAVSRRAVEITGYSSRELKGKHFTFLVVPEHRDCIKELIDAVLGKGPSFSKVETVVLCKDGTSKIITFDMAPVQVEGKIVGAVAACEDVTAARRTEEALKQSELELRLLSSRLLDLQDSERRRIARELHDGTAQNLFALNIALSRMLQQASTEESRNSLQECLSLCELSREEIRTLSYVLHPPMLDEAGLVSALKWYVDGFSARSGIRVDLTADPALGRLPIDIETDLFRVVQECLANIHRHSGSVAAAVKLDRNTERVLLQIRDWGRGMPAEITSGQTMASPGVGIPGMHERLAQHQGNLEIRSNNKGTIVTATVPLVPMHRPHDVGRRQ